jgi:ribosomal protein L10
LDYLFPTLKIIPKPKNIRHKINGAFSHFQIATAGVSQGSDIAPFLFNVFTRYLPLNPNTLLGTYAGDTAILAIDNDPNQATQKIQNHLSELNIWFHNWKINVNPAKSSQVTFILRSLECPPTFIENTQIPFHTQTKYLGLTLDKRLTWVPHLKNNAKLSIQDFTISDLYSVLSSPSKQKIYLHGSSKTHLVLWYPTLGLSETVQYQNNTGFSIYLSTINNRRSLVHH